MVVFMVQQNMQLLFRYDFLCFWHFGRTANFMFTSLFLMVISCLIYIFYFEHVSIMESAEHLCEDEERFKSGDIAEYALALWQVYWLHKILFLWIYWSKLFLLSMLLLIANHNFKKFDMKSSSGVQEHYIVKTLFRPPCL